MRPTTLLTSTLPLLFSLTTALPLATSPPLEISALAYHRTEGANVTLTFIIHDPDPLTNATSTCHGQWAYGSGGWPSGSYETCGNSTFAWNMQAWTSWQSFVIGVEHSFKDPAVGDPPYDVITNFAKANISEPAVECNAMGGRQSCLQPKGGVIKASVYASIA